MKKKNATVEAHARALSLFYDYYLEWSRNKNECVSGTRISVVANVFFHFILFGLYQVAR